MTERLTLSLYEPTQAHKAIGATWKHVKAMLVAGHRLVLEVRPETRSLRQNARLWAMLTDISRQVDWYGKKLTQDEWKDVFTASLKKQKAVPGIDGGFVVIGARTSKMTKAEMSELQELMAAFGAEHGVLFRDMEHHVDAETGEIYA